MDDDAAQPAAGTNSDALENLPVLFGRPHSDMKYSEKFKSLAKGFSPKRTAYILNGVLLTFIGLSRTNLATNYEFRNVAILSDLGLFAVVAVLCLSSPRSADRWLPLIVCGLSGILICNL